MQTSNHLLAAIGLFSLTAVQADVATFTTTEGKLTGELLTIDKDGIIEWQSPYSQAPLKVLAAKLERVEFSTSPEAEGPSPIQLTLRNGDIIPANAITSMEEGNMITESAIAGPLTIPRNAIASAQFGITEKNVIYDGFDNIRDWTTGKGEPANWKRQGNALVSTGSSVAAHDFEMPRNFVLEFDLSWQTRSPNFSISFADPLVKDTNKQDLYRFNFDTSGMRLQRHKPGERRARTLDQWQRRPSSFKKSSFEVQLRVDRDKRQIELFIDGQSEGVVIDPTGDVPLGSGVTITCQPPTSGTQTISQLSISELNDSRTRHLAEERGDASQDCIITTDDDRWSGQLMSLSGTPEERTMVFKTKFAEEAWEIPESEISTLFFANNPFKEGPGGKPKFFIEFHGKGNLTVSQCIITGDQVEATHPLLGSLQLERSSIRLIRRID